MGCCRKQPERTSLTSIVPYKRRSCTDTIVLALFVAAWAFIVYIVSVAVRDGNPNRLVLTHGTDMNGSTCGVDSDVIDKPYAAWPFPSAYQSMICLSSCNQTLTDTNMALPMPSTPVLYYCVPDVGVILNISRALNVSVSDLSPAASLLASGSNEALQSVGDLLIAWKLLVGSTGMTIVLCFAWMLFLNYFAGAVIWSLFLALVVGGGLAGYALLQHVANVETDPTVSAQNILMMRVIAYVLIGFTVAMVLVLIALRKRIGIAIAVIKEASHTMNAVKSMLLFPIVPFALCVGFLVGWIVLALYIYSVGDYVTVDTPNTVLYSYLTGIRNGNPSISREFQWNKQFQYYFVFHLFMLFWTCETFVYLTFTVLAGTVADHYFTPKNDRQRQAIADMEAVQSMQRSAMNGDGVNTVVVKPHGDTGTTSASHSMSRFPIMASLARTLRFHLGTILAAALLIAIIEMIRAVVAYVQAQTRNRQSKLQKALFVCIDCCLRCLQSFVDKVNKNALIYSSIYGTGFVASVSQSFQLIMNNLFRVAAINLVSKFLIMLGKLAISAIVTGVCLLLCMRIEYYGTNLHSFFAISIVVFALNFCLVSLFMALFSATIDTIFLCFLIDCDENEKQGIMLASDSLRALIQNHSKQSEIAARWQLDKQVYSNQIAPTSNTVLVKPV